MSSLLAHFTNRQSAILELTRHLVERETTSRDEARLNEIASFVAGLFQELHTTVELFPQTGYGTHLRVRCGFGNPSAEKQVLVIGHLDTVWPVGTLQRMPFRFTEDGKLHGPGVFDMKSGVACLVEAVRTIKAQGLETRRPLTILLTCDEEIGSRTSRALVEAEAMRSTAALVLEPPLPGGVVKTGRKGIGVFSLRAVGRAAHAGLDPSKGINAVVELAHQTLRLAALNDFERGTTVNVGVFNGGTTTNVVPAEAAAKIDVRFWTQADGEYLENTIRSLRPVLPEAQLEIGGGINRPPMPRSPENVALFEHARGLAGELGFELRDGVVGGGSDGNFTAALGVPTLDGLGVDGAGAHADHEHIIINDIPRRTALLTRLLQTT
jgi:glutamate carboxypeptidase